MATLEDEFSGKFGRPVRKEDVRLGQRSTTWPGNWDLSVGSARFPWGNVGNVGKCGKMWETPPVLDGISMKLWENQSFLQWETVTTSSKTLIAIYFSTGKDERTWENYLLKYF